MQRTQGLIVDSRVLAPGYYQMTLLAPEIAATAGPGQFIEVRVADGTIQDPLLARPLSLFRINRKEGTISFIFKIVGRGTRLLATLKTGGTVVVWGPLGNHFNPPGKETRIALVAGGVGMPPMFALAEFLREATGPDVPEIVLFYGGRTRCDLLELDSWNKLGVTVHTATEDGSFGSQGVVTVALEEALKGHTYDYIASCGPIPMLRAVQQLAMRYRVPGQMSLEAYMACGVGACLGCVCETRRGFLRVCSDGPVFPIEEVIFP